MERMREINLKVSDELVGVLYWVNGHPYRNGLQKARGNGV